MIPKSPGKLKPSRVRPSTKSSINPAVNNPSSPINIKTKGLLCDDEGGLQDTSFTGSDTFQFASDSTNKIFGKKTKQKLKNLTKLLPDYKIDLKLQLSIISTLKELNCWSDDEDDNISEEPTPTTTSLPMFSPQAVKAAKIKLNERVVEDDNSIMDRMLNDLHNAESQASGGDASTISSYSNSPVSPLKRKQFKAPPRIDTTTFNDIPFIPAEIPAHKPMRRVSIMEIKAKTTTPRTDFQSSRDQIRSRILTKAVQLMADKHVEKKEAEKRERLKQAMYGTEAYRLTVIGKFSGVVAQIVTEAALKRVVAKKSRLRVRAASRLVKETQAVSVLNRAWRNFRLRKLWSGILLLVNRKLLLRQEEELRDECEYRIRAAHRRVREDREFRAYKHQRAAQLGLTLDEPLLFEVLVPMVPTAPLQALPSKEDDDKSVGSLRKADYTTSPRRSVTKNASSASASFSVGQSVQSAAHTSSMAVSTAGKKPFVFPSLKSTPKIISDFEYARPDLAPFSTRINAAIQATTLFPQEQTWEQLAAVDDAFVARVKAGTNKSAAYKALQQLCGLSEQDILNRKSELGPEHSNKRQFRIGGSSILSL